ncbi:MAG: hypothetical protein U1F33_01375 [Alphaproteobacteria bacterium]
MAAAPYIGRFTPDSVTRLLDAAAPIPTDGLKEEDKATGEFRIVPLAEVIVRHLEWLDTWAQLGLQHSNDLPPSALAKRLGSISSAANSLLDALGASPDGEPNRMPRQVFNALLGFAESDAERLGGFPNHPLVHIRARGVEYPDYQGANQLFDNIAGITQIRNWSTRARDAARQQVGSNKIEVDTVNVLGMEPLIYDPVNDAIGGILNIWTTVLGREVKTAVGEDGIAYGKLIQFTLACLAVLNLTRGRDGKPFGEDAVRARIRRLVDMADTRR